MKRYAHVEVHVDRPADEVFAFLCNFENNPDWLRGMKSSRFTTGGEFGVGTRYEQVARFLGKEIRSSFEVVGFEPGRSVTIDTVEGPFPIKVTRAVRPEGDGTAVIEDVWGDATGFYRIAHPLLRLLVQRNVARDYRRLKEVLEQRS
jgi:carbon monoxide dehydrogenase subunit G